MSIRRLLEKDVLIRLTETGFGFVETVRYFGISTKTSVYEAVDPEPRDEVVTDERLMLTRLNEELENPEQPQS